jgi:hypothetical protein
VAVCFALVGSGPDCTDYRSWPAHVQKSSGSIILVAVWKFTVLLELGMVVDTTMPVSITLEAFQRAFQKCRPNKELRVVESLSVAQHAPLTAFSSPLCTGTNAASQGSREGQP